MAEEIRLSKAAIEKIKDELDRLTHEVKPSLVERVSQARAHGDLSENADFDAAREELARVEGRIKELEQRLKYAFPVEAIDDGIASEGKLVTIELQDGSTREFVIASRDEKGVLSLPEGVSLLSPGSPLGSACLGRKAGDVLRYETPSGEMTAVIVNVRLPGS